MEECRRQAGNTISQQYCDVDCKTLQDFQSVIGIIWCGFAIVGDCTLNLVNKEGRIFGMNPLVFAGTIKKVEEVFYEFLCE